MTTNMVVSPPPTTMSAIQARQGFGGILDMSFYQGKSFLIERAGKLMVAIIPAAEYEDVQRIKQEAKDRFFAKTDDIRQKVETSQVSNQELETAIHEAVQEVRAENAEQLSTKAE